MSRYVDIEPYEKDGWYLQRRHRNSYGESIMTAPLVSVPTAEAEPVKHGRWKKVVHSNNNITHYCSECKSVFYKGCADQGEYNYCPNCGARMDGNNGE